MSKVKDTNYLAITAMLAARETKMLSAERMERMIDAPTNDEAAKILEECGYGDLSGLSAKEAGAALEAHIAALFDEVEGMVPEAQLVQLFRLKYDYHNAKALIKARAMGVECDAILSQRGTVAPQKLLTAFLEEDYRDIPPILAQAMVSAAAILAHTANPQAAGFILEMVKTIRGLGGIAVTSTQGMQDLFGLEGGSYGKGILDASRIKLVMQMEEQEARLIQDKLNLSEDEVRQITRFRRGEGLLCIGYNHVPVAFYTTPKEYEAITTSPTDLRRGRQGDSDE